MSDEPNIGRCPKCEKWSDTLGELVIDGVWIGVYCHACRPATRATLIRFFGPSIRNWRQCNERTR